MHVFIDQSNPNVILICDNRGGKKVNKQSGTMKTLRKPNEQLFSQ